MDTINFDLQNNIVNVVWLYIFIVNMVWLYIFIVNVVWL